RGVPVGKNKTVAVVPGRIGRVVLQEVVPQHFGDISHTHGGARVAGIGFLYGIHAEGANGVGELFTGHSSLRGKVKVWRREDLRVCAGRRRTDGCRPPVFPRPLDPDCAPSGIPLRSWVLVLAERWWLAPACGSPSLHSPEAFSAGQGRWSAGRSPRARGSARCGGSWPPSRWSRSGAACNNRRYYAPISRRDLRPPHTDPSAVSPDTSRRYVRQTVKSGTRPLRRRHAPGRRRTAASGYS